MTEARKKQFIESFVRLTPTLSIRLAKVIRTNKRDRAQMVDDLLQVVAEQTWRYMQLPQNDQYQVEVLIWLRVDAVISTYVRSTKKMKHPEPLNPEVSCQLPGPYQFLLQRQVLNYLYIHSDTLTWQICVFIREGWTYKQIAKVIKISENAIKMRIHRLKEELKIYDLRDDSQK
jgi:hypothetical protein